MASNRRSYAELLLDPQWQRKRLEVLSAADFACAVCRSSVKTLHVHHTYYKKGLKPWEYPDDALRCLCSDCHKATEEVLSELAMAVGPLGPDDLRQVVGYARAVTALEKGVLDPAVGVFVPINGWPDRFGVGDAVHASFRDVELATTLDGLVDVAGLSGRFLVPFYDMVARQADERGALKEFRG